MTLRRDIIAEARRWIGTRFIPKARVRGVGVDCWGLIVGVCESCGLGDVDHYDFLHGRMKTYPGDQRASLLADFFGPEHEESIPGDVCIFWMDPRTGLPQHAAIQTEIGIIHCHENAGEVVEHRLTETWMKRYLYSYSLPKNKGGA